MLLQICENHNGKIKADTPKVRWLVLNNNFVLYLYKRQSDKKALMSLPVPGFTIHYGHDELKDDDPVPKDNRTKVRLEISKIQS